MHRIITCLIMMIALFISPLSFADKKFVEQPSVQSFINMMVKKYKFDRQELFKIFSTVKSHPQVLRQLNRPLEKESWRLYQMVFVNEWRIEHGVKFWNTHEAALKRAEEKYGVPASVIVATIGVETKYGANTGKFRVLDSLSYIAFSNSKRVKFFRNELEQFLLLCREQHLDPLKVMGSYAGAIGQPQFMPSSYRKFAIDFSNSGKIDLIHDDTDVIGSIANYYKQHGWVTDAPVAVPALTLGTRYNYMLISNAIRQPLTIAQLEHYGIVPKYKIGPDDLKVSIIQLPNRFSNEYWIGFNNFNVIKRYNPSDLYAMAVYQLSAYINELREKEENG